MNVPEDKELTVKVGRKIVPNLYDELSGFRACSPQLGHKCQAATDIGP